MNIRPLHGSKISGPVKATITYTKNQQYPLKAETAASETHSFSGPMTDARKHLRRTQKG